MAVAVAHGVRVALMAGLMKIALKPKYVFQIAVLASLLAYQNCSNDGFLPSAGLSDGSSFSAKLANADLVWTLKYDGSGPSLSRIGQATRWADAGGNGISIFPPAITGANQLNLDAAPVATSSDTGTFLSFGPQKTLMNEAGDVSFFQNPQYTFAMYVKNIQLPTVAPQVLRIFEFYPADGSQSGYLGIDVSEIGGGVTEFRAFDWFDGNNYTLATVHVPTSTLTRGFGIAIRYDNDPAKLSLAVNGATSTFVTKGAPPMLGNVVRQLNIHGLNFGQMGSFEMGEFAFWRMALDDTYLTAYSQAERASFDQGGAAVALPPAPITEGGDGVLRFAAIQGNFTVCANCHSYVGTRAQVLGAVGANNTTPWVIPGNSSASLVIQALQHQGGAQPMPKDLPALSADQINQIARWIDQGAN